jgi:phospholipase A-2-activating protein
VSTLDIHKQPVWGVAFDPASYILYTASADKTIRRIRLSDATLQPLSFDVVGSHDDVARSLVLTPDRQTLYSCSNDGLIGAFDVSLPEPRPRAVYGGHANFVYDLALTPESSTSKKDEKEGEEEGMLVASASEDRTVRLWSPRYTHTMQALPHPAPLWTVCFLSRHVLVSAGGDGTLRIWGTAPQLAVRTEAVLGYREVLRNSKVPEQTVFHSMPSTTTGGDELIEGVYVLNKTTHRALLYTSALPTSDAGSATTGTTTVGAEWVDVGELVDRPPRERVMHDGKLYDFVFEVDLPQGQGKAKLPYNVDDNPYWAAQQFIDKHELSQDYLQQIAEWVVANAKGVELGPSSAGGNSGAPSSVENMPQSLTQKKPATVLPFGTMYTFGGLSFEPMMKRLTECVQCGAVPLSDAEWRTLSVGLYTVQGLLSTASSNTIRMSDKETALLHRILADAEAGLVRAPECMVPVLDLVRLLALQDPSRPSLGAPEFRRVAQLVTMQGAPKPVVLVGLRVLANALASRCHQVAVYDGLLEWTRGLEALRFLYEPQSEWSPAARTALAQLMLNFAVLACARQDAGGVAGNPAVLEFLAAALGHERDVQAALRLVAALGTHLYTVQQAALKSHSGAWGEAKQRVLGCREHVVQWMVVSGDDKALQDLRNLCGELLDLMDFDV